MFLPNVSWEAQRQPGHFATECGDIFDTGKEDIYPF
jgi:hypothetical protein